MSFNQARTGLRAGTDQNLVLDAGLVIVNFNVDEYLNAPTEAEAYDAATDSSAGFINPNTNTTVFPYFLGATRGGTTVRLNKNMRQVEVDGRRTNIRGLWRVDSIEPSLRTSLIEVADVTTLQLTLGSSDRVKYSHFTKVTPTLLPRDTDYLANIAIVSSVAGGGDIIWVMENVLATSTNDITMVDKNECNIEIDLMANSLPEQAFRIPCYALIPNEYNHKTNYDY